MSEWGRAEVEHSTRNSGHFGDESQSLALVLTLLFILVRYARWQHCGCSMECVYGKHQLPNDQCHSFSFFIVYCVVMVMMPARIYTMQSLISSTACCVLAVCFYLALQTATSSLMYVMDVNRCRLWLLSPTIWQCNTLNGNRSPSILVTCPNHVSRFVIFWTSDSSCCNILHIGSFLILYLLVTHYHDH